MNNFFYRFNIRALVNSLAYVIESLLIAFNPRGNFGSQNYYGQSPFTRKIPFTKIPLHNIPPAPYVAPGKPEPIKREPQKQYNYSPNPPKKPKKEQFLIVRIFACVVIGLVCNEFIPFVPLFPFLKFGATAIATTFTAYIGSWLVNGIKYPFKLKTFRFFFFLTAALSSINLLNIGNTIGCIITAAIGILVYCLTVMLEKLVTKSKSNQSEKAKKPKKAKEPKPEPVKEEKKTEKIKKSNTGNPELDQIIDQGNEYITKLKDADIAIEHNGISLSIRRMEKACQSIFEYITEKPAKINQIKKFLNYYLPTTLKLLDSYEKMDRQSYKGENINSTMFEIEGMMNTIAVAFEKQLDSLFGQEAMDIQADISVFDSILKQEGLSDEEETATK